MHTYSFTAFDDSLRADSTFYKANLIISLDATRLHPLAVTKVLHINEMRLRRITLQSDAECIEHCLPGQRSIKTPTISISMPATETTYNTNARGHYHLFQLQA